MKVFASICLLVSFPTLARAANYPIGPDPVVTPGSVCQIADEVRYPEKIAYCSRSVERDLKQAIIRDYDEKFGYRIASMNRGDFKIDLFIPLCAGGSNQRDNLWPQHKSVFVQTDLLEQMVCEKMKKGLLTQVNAIGYIKTAKLNLSRAREVLKEVQEL